MAHTITSEDQWFLSLRRHDPLQGSEFELGDKVVVCTKCKCVQAYDSWAFNENKCVQCGNNRSTDDFSREYIDFSYHRESNESRTIRGFKVVESDIKYQTDKIRKWFSQQRISHTSKERLWFNLILVFLLIGLICYWGYDSINDYMISMVLPIFDRMTTKLQYIQMQKLSSIDIASKFSCFNKGINQLINKYDFLQGKFIILYTSILFIGHKVLYSFSHLDYTNKGSTVARNFETLMDYITRFFKR